MSNFPQIVISVDWFDGGADVQLVLTYLSLIIHKGHDQVFYWRHGTAAVRVFSIHYTAG